jgi:hypothetical protein
MADFLLQRPKKSQFWSSVFDDDSSIMISYTGSIKKNGSYEGIKISVTTDIFAELQGIEILKAKKYVFKPMLKKLLRCDPFQPKIFRRGSWEKLLVSMYRAEKLKEKQEKIDEKKLNRLLNSSLSAEENSVFEKVEK